MPKTEDGPGDLSSVILPYTRVLVEVLGLANPGLFGRTIRVQQYAEMLATHLEVSNVWHVEVAAAFSQIGFLLLSPSAQKKAFFGEELDGADRIMLDHIPHVIEHMVSQIPGVAPIQRILRYKDKQFSGRGLPADAVEREQIPIGSRVLKVVLDYDGLESQGLTSTEALRTMRRRLSRYDPKVFNAFTRVLGDLATEQKKLYLSDLRPGMIFAEDVSAPGGALLVANGYVATQSALERLRRFEGIEEPVLMKVPIVRIS